MQTRSEDGAWLRDWFDGHPLAHLVYDPLSLRLLAANQAAVARYGFSLQQLLQLTRRDLLWPDQWAAFDDFLSGLPATMTGPQRVWRERTQSGAVLLSDVRSVPISFQGQPARLAVFMDAGPRTRLEAEVTEQRDRLAATLRAIPDLWFILDAQGRYLEISSPDDPSLAGTWAETVGRRFPEVVPREHGERVVRAMEQARQTGQLQAFSYEIETSGKGRRWFEARLVPMDDGRFLYLTHDMTTARQAEEALRGRALAEEARRQQAEFLSRMSHELRTPLNAILGFGQLLENELSPDSAAGRQLAHINSAGAQMLQLVDELLQLPRLHHGSRAPVRLPLASALNDGVALLQTLAHRHRVGTETLADQQLHVRADAQRLQQVVVHLGAQAIRASAAGGSVRFEASAAGPDMAQLEIAYDGVHAADTGLAQLLVPLLHATDPAAPRPPGVALGLSIAYELVQQMGGTLEVQAPTAGQRMRVVTRLPLAPA